MSSEIEFDEDKFGTGAPSQPSVAVSKNAGGSAREADLPHYSSTEPAMVRWLIRKRWAKSVKAANSILISVIVVCVIFTFILVKLLIS